MIHIKCLKCGDFTKSAEFCEICNEPLNTEKKRIASVKEDYDKRLLQREEPFKVVVFIGKMKSHPNLFIKAIGYLLNSVLAVILFIVTVISYIIGFLLAG